MQSKRVDIQALRGAAVSFVLLDHAGIWPFRNGYLGVDVFFVISGYLITGIISRDMQAGDFNFGGFYARRARRILPAAYVTIVLTAIGAIWFVNPSEMRALGDQIAGAFTYTINFVLLAQSGYFDAAAAYKPLLHLWSLAVEEQFYIFFPLFLYVVPARRWLPAVAALTVVSLIACLVAAQNHHETAFYLLPTRAWELGLGGLGALLPEGTGRRIASVAFWPSVAALPMLAVWSTGLPHPGVDALLICVASLVIILANEERVAESLPSRVLGRIGDVSYSLYLVHWPIVVFLQSAYMGPVPLWLRLAALILSALLAVAMYFGVERPFLRTARLSPRLVAGGIAASALVASTPFVPAAVYGSTPDYAYLTRPNYGLDRACDSQTFKPAPPCLTSAHPEIMIWGDSYAMHVVTGIAEQVGSQGIVQATFSACPSLLGEAPEVKRLADPEGWARKCIAFNRSVLEYLTQTPSITTVVLASAYGPLAQGLQEMLSENPDGALVRRHPDAAYLIDKLGHTVQAVMQLGKKVLVIGPPPDTGDQATPCIERRTSGKIVFGPDPRCFVSKANVDANFVTLNLALDQVRDLYGAKVARIADALCFDGYCHGYLDGVLIYRGDGHLTYAGSSEVMRRLGIERYF